MVTAAVVVAVVVAVGVVVGVVVAVGVAVVVAVVVVVGVGVGVVGVVAVVVAVVVVVGVGVGGGGVTMNRNKAAALMSKYDRAATLYDKGSRCLHDVPGCCPCGHKGSSFVTVDGNPAACSCGKCPRYRCLECAKVKTDFCIVMTQIAIEEGS